LIEEEKRGRSVELSEFSSEDDEEDVGSADEKIANSAATVVAVVATLRRVLSMKKVLRRLISPAEIAEKLAFLGDLC
jgi:hypothetical protein